MSFTTANFHGKSMFAIASGCVVLGAAAALLLPGYAPKKPVSITPALKIDTSAHTVPIATPTPVDAIPDWARSQVIRKVPVGSERKVIALTFDDGPWPGSTKRILKILADNHIRATFFMIGSVLSDYPRLGRAVRDAGMAIGNHSWDHPIRPQDPVGEITDTDAEIHKILGITPTLFRPPYGALDNGLATQAKQERDAVILWSADPRDWSRPGANAIASVILRQASSGGICLMHDGGGDRSETVAALPRIIATLRQRGYEFVTVPELLAMRTASTHVEHTAKSRNITHS